MSYDHKAALKQQAMLRSMVQTNHHRSQTIPGNIHDEEAFFHNRQETHKRDMAARQKVFEQLTNNELHVPTSLANAIRADMASFQAQLSENQRLGIVSPEDSRKAFEAAYGPLPLAQTDATTIVTSEGEKRPAAGYPFKDEVVVSLEHYEKTVAELAAARYEVTKLKQKVNDLTNALSNARDAAATIARDKGHLERRIGELVVEAEHYKARMKR